ncbi:hypothetical protein ACHAWX_001635 [Stephanocyclus meneghinianus]
MEAIEMRKAIRNASSTIVVRSNNHPLASIVAMMEGSGRSNAWKLVDWSNPISATEETLFSCDWTTYISSNRLHQAEMCVHSFQDVISNTIKRSRSKNWSDCRILPKLWTANGMADDDSLYVDIGANIGSCVLEMLFSTRATIVAFEPHPMNVYNIKKTVSRLGASYQDRLLLFPIGLGKSPGNSTIYSANNNMGNSQIGKMAKDWDTQMFDEKLQFNVDIERLDSILDGTKIDTIRLVKMDVQGFECNTIDGMGMVGDKIEMMKFEYEPRFLKSQGCLDLVSRVKGLGLKVFEVDLVTEVIEDSNMTSNAVELYATKRQRVEIDGKPILSFDETQRIPVSQNISNPEDVRLGHLPSSIFIAHQGSKTTNSIDIVSLTVKDDFFTLFNNSAMASWIRYIKNVRSITFIGPPSDYFLFQQNMKYHNASIASSLETLAIPIRWVNETHWIEKCQMKHKCLYPGTCQQLIKLHVFELRTHLALSYIGDNILIVDSDTVWSRETTFIHPNNTVTYFERISKYPNDDTCTGLDPVRFTEAITIGRKGKDVTEEEADEYNFKHTRTPYKSCRRSQLYSNATGTRHIVHFMLFQYDVMMHLHSVVTEAWNVSSLWQAATMCHRFTFCKSRMAEYELYYSFVSEHYPGRMHIEHLVSGVDWMNGAVCDAKDMNCCHEKNVLLKGCHDHRIKMYEVDNSDPGDMCCEL